MVVQRDGMAETIAQGAQVAVPGLAAEGPGQALLFIHQAVAAHPALKAVVEKCELFDAVGAAVALANPGKVNLTPLAVVVGHGAVKTVDVDIRQPGA